MRDQAVEELQQLQQRADLPVTESAAMAVPGLEQLAGRVVEQDAEQLRTLAADINGWMLLMQKHLAGATGVTHGADEDVQMYGDDERAAVLGKLGAANSSAVQGRGGAAEARAVMLSPKEATKLHEALLQSVPRKKPRSG